MNKRVIFSGSALLLLFGCIIMSCGDNGDESGDNPTIINISTIIGVTAPATGETPEDAITETEQYTGTIIWKETVSGNFISGPFASMTQYTAIITLTEKNDYTLTGVTENFFMVAGAVSSSNAADSGVITAVFPVTGTIYSITGLNAHLKDLFDNSADTPYMITLNIDSFSSGYDTLYSILTSRRKYVSLDFSASTFTSIPEYAFCKPGDAGNAFLTKIIMPNSVTSIGRYAFFRCSNLASVSIGDGVTSIGQDAFGDCTSLTSITIPNNVISIDGRVFEGCTNLANVTIGNGVTSIGYYAFSNCTSLTSVTIPNSVTSIGENVFSFCASLSEINVAAGNDSYTAQDGVLYNKDKSTLIVYPARKADVSFNIPDSVINIGQYAFQDCISLTSVIIPDSVINIGQYAFHLCSNLASVSIGDGVTSIGQGAFFCGNFLTSVTFQGLISPDDFTDYNTFPGDLRAKYLASEGGPGTYTRSFSGEIWTKQ